MRSLIVATTVAMTLTACATQPTPPAAAPALAPAAAAPVQKAPECFNGDSGKFEAVGAIASISGVKVVCEKTSDGKNASWVGMKK